nr:30S ribosomal protein S26e [Candidatus Prometheoarchaeum syntrophicum]QEE17789.1 30S ribosomal protein S26e [Candidatus Prometheoarchaeum syntrophicum]
MPKKRRSGGRTGSKGGRDGSVHCAKCGRLVPRGKAKRVTKFVSLVDGTIAKELRDSGAIVPRRQESSWYCISCAIHNHKIHIRASGDRNKREKIR